MAKRAPTYGVRRKWVRPTTSIFEREVKRQYPTKVTDIDFYVGVSEFGKEGRMAGIGNRAPPPKPPPVTPGPGFYDTPADRKDTRLPHRISDAPHKTISCEMTTNIGYIDSHIFPSVKSRTIGERDAQCSFIQKNDTPACRMMAQSQLSRRSHAIEGKFKDDKGNGAPGPAEYELRPVQKGPAYWLSGPKFRDDWLIDTKASPDPSQYSPEKPKTELPKYSIGYRSRQKSKKMTPFPVGQFVAQIDEEISVSEARAYVHSHPQIREVIEEIFSVIYRNKPAAPVDHLREYYGMAGPGSARRKSAAQRRVVIHRK